MTEYDEGGRLMGTTMFLRWGRLAPLPIELRARLHCYTHTGQARIIELDRSELLELIDQAQFALGAIYQAESQLRCALCGHTATRHAATGDDGCMVRDPTCDCGLTRGSVLAASKLQPDSRSL